MREPSWHLPSSSNIRGYIATFNKYLSEIAIQTKNKLSNSLLCLSFFRLCLLSSGIIFTQYHENQNKQEAHHGYKHTRAVTLYPLFHRKKLQDFLLKNNFYLLKKINSAELQRWSFTGCLAPQKEHWGRNEISPSDNANKRTKPLGKAPSTKYKQSPLSRVCKFSICTWNVSPLEEQG